MSLRIYPYILAAGETRSLDVSGEIVCVRESPFPVQVSLDGESPIVLERGDKIRRKYIKVAVTNPTASPVTVKLLLGGIEGEDYTDGRLSVKPLVAVRGVTLFNASPTSNAAASAQLVEAASDERVELVIYAHTTNTGPINISSEQAAQRLIAYVTPGQTYRMAYRGAAYAFAQNPGVDTCIVWATYYN